jgi:hypothetical protein
MPCLGWRCITGTGVMRLKLLLLVVSVCNFASFIYIVLSQNFWHFKRPKRTTSFPAMYIYIYIKKKRSGLSRVCLGRPGSGSTRRVSPGQILDGFLLRPEPVPSLGWPGPKSTRRAGPGFKTMLPIICYFFLYN